MTRGRLLETCDTRASGTLRRIRIIACQVNLQARSPGDHQIILTVPSGMLRRVVTPSLPRLLVPWNLRCYTVLALESSADDTCAAIVNSDREILSNIVVKQHS